MYLLSYWSLKRNSGENHKKKTKILIDIFLLIRNFMNCVHFAIVRYHHYCIFKTHFTIFLLQQYTQTIK